MEVPCIGDERSSDVHSRSSRTRSRHVAARDGRRIGSAMHRMSVQPFRDRGLPRRMYTPV